jgi:glycosyltransferase involved in cell wall biosynthesis
MIVKNESKVIERCLDSMSKLIDYWVIVDTGSTDGTQDIIKSHMGKLGIPGELHERAWKDYGTNRTESMELSKGKCDYRFIMDADDILEVADENAFANLELDSYKVAIHLNEIMYYRTQLVRSDQDWEYIGVLHEYIAFKGESTPSEGSLDDVSIKAGVSGDTRELKGREKYYNDALIFERELVNNKDLHDGLRMRYQFYCAQSYRDAHMYDRALEAYEKRASMGGWPEEVYVSKYNAAKMKAMVKKPIEEVIDALMRAWEYRPIRLEAAYELMKIFIHQERYFMAFSIGHICSRMGPCGDVLFVEPEIWRWKFLDDYSIACFRTGNFDDAFRNGTTLMESDVWKEIPEGDQKRITENVESYKKAVDEIKRRKEESEKTDI